MSEHNSKWALNLRCWESLGKLPNEPNDRRSVGSGGLGKLPNEPNDRRSVSSGGLGKLPNEPNDRGRRDGSFNPGDSAIILTPG